jgi:hypothetical protein
MLLLYNCVCSAILKFCSFYIQSITFKQIEETEKPHWLLKVQVLPSAAPTTKLIKLRCNADKVL